MEEPETNEPATNDVEEDFESSFGLRGFSPLQVGMLNAHELYCGAREAGFNPGQALYLVACAVTGGPRPPAGSGVDGLGE